MVQVLCESVAPRWGEEGSSVTKRRRHTPDQIIRKLAEGSKLVAGGTELDEVCRHLQVAESTRIGGSRSTAA